MLDPLYTHDCDDCIYLGRSVTTQGITPLQIDVYVDCHSDESEDTLLMRYSDDESNYSAMPIRMARLVDRETGWEGWTLALALYDAFQVGRNSL